MGVPPPPAGGPQAGAPPLSLPLLTANPPPALAFGGLGGAPNSGSGSPSPGLPLLVGGASRTPEAGASPATTPVPAAGLPSASSAVPSRKRLVAAPAPSQQQQPPPSQQQAGPAHAAGPAGGTAAEAVLQLRIQPRSASSGPWPLVSGVSSLGELRFYRYSPSAPWYACCSSLDRLRWGPVRCAEWAVDAADRIFTGSAATGRLGVHALRGDAVVETASLEAFACVSPTRALACAPARLAAAFVKVTAAPHDPGAVVIDPYADAVVAAFAVGESVVDVAFAGPTLVALAVPPSVPGLGSGATGAGGADLRLHDLRTAASPALSAVSVQAAPQASPFPSPTFTAAASGGREGGGEVSAHGRSSIRGVRAAPDGVTLLTYASWPSSSSSSSSASAGGAALLGDAGSAAASGFGAGGGGSGGGYEVKLWDVRKLESGPLLSFSPGPEGRVMDVDLCSSRDPAHQVAFVYASGRDAVLRKVVLSAGRGASVERRGVRTPNASPVLSLAVDKDTSDRVVFACGGSVEKVLFAPLQQSAPVVRLTGCDAGRGQLVAVVHPRTGFASEHRVGAVPDPIALRCLRGYDADPARNARVVGEELVYAQDPDARKDIIALKRVWEWVSRDGARLAPPALEALLAAGLNPPLLLPSSAAPALPPPVPGSLGAAPGMEASAVPLNPALPTSKKKFGHVTLYSNPERAALAKLCGWGGPAIRQASEASNDALVAALFVLDMRDVRSAVERLMYARDASLRLAAATFSGWPGVEAAAATTAAATSASAAGGGAGAGAASGVAGPLLRSHSSDGALQEDAGNAAAAAAAAAAAGVGGVVVAMGGAEGAAAPDAGYAMDPSQISNAIEHVYLWCEAALAVESRFESLMLRHACHFLVAACRAGDGSWLRLVLADEAVSLTNRVAIACRYASDEQLAVFLDGAFRTARERGSVEGLLVTGLTTEAAYSVLASYVDRTGDVQSAALLACAAEGVPPTPQALKVAPRFQRWLDAYRRALDGCGLFMHRAKLDVAVAAARREAGRANPVPDSIHAHCGRCGQTLAGPQRPEAARGSSAVSAQAKPIVARCLSCDRALPSCSVCLRPLTRRNPFSTAVEAPGLNDWFAWCVACKHGGHAGCMRQWHSTRARCPVASCACAGAAHLGP